MKETVNVAAVQFASEPLSREVNAARIASIVDDEAANYGSDLVVFPELATTGYIDPHTDTEFAKTFYQQSETVPGPTCEVVGEATARRKVYAVVGLSRRHPNNPHLLYNTAVLLGPDGEIVGVHDKVHPCLEEKNYFAPGNSADVFETDLGLLAINVCYDTRFPELARVQALKGAEIIVSLWASFVQPGRVPTDTILHRCATRALENAVYFVASNRSGREGDRVFYGRSAIADPSGEVLAASDSDGEEILRASLYDSTIAEQRAYLTIFRDRRPDLYRPLTEPL